MPISISKIELKHSKYGTWTYDAEKRLIGGKPLPSEEEAHKFRTEAIPQIEEQIANVLCRVFKGTEY